MKNSNVTRMLDAKNIRYEPYDLPPEKLSAIEVARLLNVPAEQVFKTIVITPEKTGKPILAVVPGSRDVDLKLLASAVGEKKVHLPTEREAERITGLQAGGISPLALINRGFKVVIDQVAKSYDQIYLSGGQRGLDLRISPQDLITLTHASVAEISKESL